MADRGSHSEVLRRMLPTERRLLQANTPMVEPEDVDEAVAIGSTAVMPQKRHHSPKQSLRMQPGLPT
jgi:hypothetical protein